MPQYRYKARGAEGKTISGVAAAADEAALFTQLKGEGLYVMSARAVRSGAKLRPLKSKQLAEFCRQVSSLLGSGISLVRALAIIAEDESFSAGEKAVYTALLRSVRQGNTLSAAMDEMGGIFPVLAVNMFRAAEQSGGLPETAERLSGHYSKEYKLQSKVKSSMTYPKVLCVLIVLAVAVIMYYVMPQFAELFSMMDSLPWATRFLMGLSDFIVAKWWLLLIAVLVIVLAVRMLFAIPSVHRWKDRTLLYLPGIGKLQRTVCTARFARTMSSLYGAGIPIVTAMQIARNTVGNKYIEGQFDDAVSFVKSGGSLSEGLHRIDGFVNKLSSSVKVGEESGSLDVMLDSIADTLDYESEMAITRMVAMLEPAMIVFMALIVGFILIAVMVPIFNSYGAIENYGA